MKFTLLPRRVLWLLLAAMMLFLATGIAVLILRDVYGFNNLLGLYPLFNLEWDMNVPTWFASTVLLYCAVLLAVIAASRQRQEGRFARHWWALSLIFLLLSIDETARIHEMVGDAIATMLIGETRGYLHYSWVIPWTILLMLFVLSYIRFLLYLPGATRWWFVISGAIYVTGALGFEMITANYIDSYGYGPVARMITVVEEGLEMLGTVAFAHTLLTYLSVHPCTITFQLAPEKVPYRNDRVEV